jgi:hypothetical protein
MSQLTLSGWNLYYATRYIKVEDSTAVSHSRPLFPPN